MNLLFRLCVLSLAVAGLCYSFPSTILKSTGQRSSSSSMPSQNTMMDRYGMNTLNRRSSRDELVKVEFVQTAFAAGCALAVFSYVWNNIEEIKVCTGGHDDNTLYLPSFYSAHNFKLPP